MLAGLGVLITPALTFAAASVASQRESVRKLEAEIAGVDARYNQAAAAYDSARGQLETVRGRIATNTKELAAARVAFQKAQSTLAFRVSAVYRRPQPTGFEFLLRARSLSAALSRVDVLDRVQRQDASAVRSIAQARERMRKARVQLLADQKEAAAQTKVTAKRLNEVRSVRAARRAVLNSARNRLAAMIAAEQRRNAQSRHLAALRAAQRAIGQPTTGGGEPSPPPPPPPASSGGGGGDVSAALRKIALCESGGNPTAVSPSGLYRGKYQFDPQTWKAYGGSGDDPAAASEAEQDRVAARLYADRGWAPWPVCGRP